MSKPSYLHSRLRERTDVLCRIMEELTEYDPKENTRRREVVVARKIVCYQLWLEGFTKTDIGLMFSKNHATIGSYISKFDDALVYPGFPEERRLWEQFKKAI